MKLLRQPYNTRLCWLHNQSAPVAPDLFCFQTNTFWLPTTPNISIFHSEYTFLLIWEPLNFIFCFRNKKRLHVHVLTGRVGENTWPAEQGTVGVGGSGMPCSVIVIGLVNTHPWRVNHTQDIAELWRARKLLTESQRLVLGWLVKGCTAVIEQKID